jgi:hypothetical protein
MTRERRSFFYKRDETQRRSSLEYRVASLPRLGGSREIPNNQAFDVHFGGIEDRNASRIQYPFPLSGLASMNPHPSALVSNIIYVTKYIHGREPTLLRLLVHDNTFSLEALGCLGPCIFPSSSMSGRRSGIGYEPRLRCLEKLGHTCLGFS